MCHYIDSEAGGFGDRSPVWRFPNDSTCAFAIGDSIAAGEGAAGVDRWPARLETLLRQDLPGRNVMVSNWAQGDSQIDLLAV